MSESQENVQLDGCFMQALQQGTGGIDGFFLNLFGFLRRRTDFFQMDDKCMETVKKNFETQLVLYKDDKVRQAALVKKREEERAKEQQKQAEAKAKKEAEVKNAAKAQTDTSATCEEVSEEEAERIMKEEAARKAAMESGEAAEEGAVDKKEEKKKEDGDGEKASNKQQPNAGNGGTTDKYEWIQTLDEVTVFIPLPDKIKAANLDVKLTSTKLTAGLKGQPAIVAGDWFKKIKTDDSMWSVESDGDKRILQLTLQKFEGQ